MAQAGSPLMRVVGAHHGIRLAFHHRLPERRQIGVFLVVKGDLHVDRVARRFGAAVHGVVLGRRDGLEVLRIVALQAANEGRAEPTGEEGVLPVGFLAPAPARVAEDVDVGRPVIEAGRSRAHAHAAAGQVRAGCSRGRLRPLVIVELGARLGADGGRHPMDERLVEGGAETDGLRKHRRDSLIRHAVQRFAPPVVGGNLKARDGGGGAAELRSLLLDGHSRDEVIHALVNRQRRIQIRRAFGLLSEHGPARSGQQNEHHDKSLEHRFPLRKLTDVEDGTPDTTAETKRVHCRRFQARCARRRPGRPDSRSASRPRAPGASSRRRPPRP